MRRALFSAFAFMALSTGAQAQVDPLNWCPEWPAVEPPPSGPLMIAADIRRTVLSERGTFSPGDEVATVQLTDAPPRRVISAREELGIQAGAMLMARWLGEFGADAMNQRQRVYCAITGEAEIDRRTGLRRPYRPGICLDEINVANTATAAFHVDFSGDGIGHMARRPGLGRMQEWAVLGEFGDAGPTVTRSLQVGRIQISRIPEFSSRPAYNAVSAEFQLEGYGRFERRLNEPLRIEDGWLVITDVSAAGTLEVRRMSDSGWRAFQQTRCPAG